MLNKKDLKFFILVTGLFTLITVILTFPLLFNLNSSIFGFTSDNFLGIWYFWAARFFSSPDFTNLARYPLGIKLAGQLEVGWSVPFWIVSYFLGPVVTFNLFTLIGFIFSAVAAYYLVNYLIKDRNISFLAGFIYAFSPYHFWQGFAHLGLGLLYTLPLYILFLLKFDRNRNIRWGLLLGLSFIFVLLTSLYYGYYLFLLTIVYFICQILIGAFQKKNYLSVSLLRSSMVSLITVIILALPVVYKIFISKTGFQNIGGVPNRPLNDLLSLSMRPWDYILPAPNHPWWGKFSNQILAIIKTKSDDFKTISAFLPERINYVGITTLITTLIGMVFTIKMKQNRQRVLLFGLLLVAVLLLSAPPFIIAHNFQINFPTFYLYSLITFFRVYARLGILALLLLLVLMSLGLIAIPLKNISKNILLVTIGVLIFIEFLPFGWGQTTSLRNQPVYDWLKSQPSGVVAEYPVDFDIADAFIWQIYHGKKLYNGLYNDELLPQRLELSDLHQPDTWLKLKAVGVNYVIFHTKYLYDKPHPINDFYYKEFSDAPITTSTSWVKVVQKFDNAVVYAPGDQLAKIVNIDHNSGDFGWVNTQAWTFSELENKIYIYNRQAKTLTAKMSFELKDDQLEQLLLNGQKISLDDSLSLKLGLNEVALTRKRSTSQLTITNFNLSLK